jgi:hypothetical protein
MNKNLKPWQWIVSGGLFLSSIWLAWPMLTLRNFPHIGWREYLALLLMITAKGIAAVNTPAKDGSEGV